MARAVATHVENRLAALRIGLWLFLLSDSFFFAVLIFARFYDVGVQRPKDLNQLLGLIISIDLVLSSLTAYRAETSATYGEQRRFQRNILFTIGFGLLFLVGVALEWIEGAAFFPPSTIFGTMFFTLTGFHAFHVFTGIIGLVALFVASRHHRFTAENHWPVEGIIKYWHFVDVVWVAIFPTLYLVS